MIPLWLWLCLIGWAIACAIKLIPLDPARKARRNVARGRKNRR